MITLLFAIPAIGQQSFDGGTLLHEFTVADKSVPKKSRRNNNGGGIPPLSADVQNDEPIFDDKGPNFSETQKEPYGDLSPFGTTNQLDDKTDRVKTLNYFSNFTPSIIPYKRAVAQNEIVKNDEKYEFKVKNQAARKVPTLKSSKPGEVFWGSFLVRAEQSRLHPLPSISPDQSIIEIQTEPKVGVTLYKDSADNFSAKIDSNALVRINIKYSVPSNYFNGIFADEPWSEFEPSRASQLSPEISTVSKRVQKKLGLSRRLSPLTNLNIMVEHFRNFEARPFPEELRKGDLYEQISIHQVGVCRHRSLAFTITANSLGIATRYIYNEAHAFVEVFWPKMGWRRIDLGGAADELNAASNDGRGLHQTAPDTLPQPEEFLKEQSRMQTDFGDDNNDATAPNVERNDDVPDSSATDEPAAAADLTLEQGDKDVSGLPVKETDLRPRPDLKILTAKSSVKRGMTVMVLASIQSQGRGLKGKKVTAFLGPAGQNILANAVVIGTSRSDSTGRIKARFTIPAEQDIGRWELFLYFKGDKEFGPALSD